MKKYKLITATLLLILGVVTSSEAFACRYAPSTFEENLAQADFIFIGKAGKEEKIFLKKYRRFDLEIMQSWKGIEEGQTSITAETPIHMCGFDPDEGTEYLIFATINDNGTIEPRYSMRTSALGTPTFSKTLKKLEDLETRNPKNNP